MHTTQTTRENSLLRTVGFIIALALVVGGAITMILGAQEKGDTISTFVIGTCIMLLGALILMVLLRKALTFKEAKPEDFLPDQK